MQNEALLDAIVSYYSKKHTGFVYRLKSTMDERKLIVAGSSVLSVADGSTPVSVYPLFERFLQQDPFILAKSELEQIIAEHQNSAASPSFDPSLLDVMEPDANRLRQQVIHLQHELRNLSNKYFQLTQTKMEQFYSYLRFGGLYIPDYVEKIARRAQNAQDCTANGAKIGYDANTQTNDSYSYFCARSGKGRGQAQPMAKKLNGKVTAKAAGENEAIHGYDYPQIDDTTAEHLSTDETEASINLRARLYSSISDTEYSFKEADKLQSYQQHIATSSSIGAYKQAEYLMNVFYGVSGFQDVNSFEGILSRVHDIVSGQAQLQQYVIAENAYIDDLRRYLAEANSKIEKVQEERVVFREEQEKRQSYQANTLLSISIVDKSSCTDMPRLGEKSLGGSVISEDNAESTMFFYHYTAKQSYYKLSQVNTETGAELTGEPDNEDSIAFAAGRNLGFYSQETYTVEFECFQRSFQTETLVTDVSIYAIAKLETKDSAVQVGKEEKVKQAQKLSLLVSRGQIDQVLTYPVDKYMMTECVCACDDKAVQMTIVVNERATYTRQKTMEKCVMTDISVEQKKYDEMRALQTSVLRRKDQLMQIIENNALDSTLRQQLMYLAGYSLSDVCAADKPASPGVYESNQIIYITASPQKKHSKTRRELPDSASSAAFAKRKTPKEYVAFLGRKDQLCGGQTAYYEQYARSRSTKPVAGHKNGRYVHSLENYPIAAARPNLPGMASMSVGVKPQPYESGSEAQAKASEKKSLSLSLAAGSVRDKPSIENASGALIVVGIAEQLPNVSDDLEHRLAKSKINYRLDNEKRWNSSYKQEFSGAEDDAVPTVQVALDSSFSEESVDSQEKYFKYDLRELRLLEGQPIPELYIGGQVQEPEYGIPDALKTKKKACAMKLASLQRYSSQKDDSELLSASYEYEQSVGYNLMDNFRYTPIKVSLDGEAVGKRLRYRSKDLAVSEDAEAVRNVVFDEEY